MQPSEYNPLDWQETAWRSLWAPAGNLPHALLLTGPRGIGKGRFAIALAAGLLCENRAGGNEARNAACGACPSCRWFASGNHPDFRHVIPEADMEGEGEAGEGEKKKASRQIRIDQIRALEEFVYVGGHRNGARVVVVEPAEAMNVAAENALLKILEEPPSSVYFVLVSSKWRRLLPTILSRCRVLKLPRPDHDAALRWLTGQGGAEAADLLPLTGGAPLLALEESERGRAAAMKAMVASLADPGRDPLALAARWEAQLQGKGEAGLSMEAVVDIVQKWLFDLVHSRQTGRVRYGAESQARRKLAAEASAAGLIRCYNDLVKMRALANHPLNPRLYLEEMAFRYLRALGSGGGR